MKTIRRFTIGSILGLAFFMVPTSNADAAGGIPCYSTYKHARFGGYTTVTCVSCSMVTKVKNMQDRGTCTPPEA